MERDGARTWWVAKAALLLALLLGALVAWGMKLWGASHGASPERLAVLGDLGTALLAIPVILFGAGLVLSRGEPWWSRFEGGAAVGMGVVMLADLEQRLPASWGAWIALGRPWLVEAVLAGFIVATVAGHRAEQRRLASRLLALRARRAKAGAGGG